MAQLIRKVERQGATVTQTAAGAWRIRFEGQTLVVEEPDTPAGWFRLLADLREMGLDI